MIKEQTHIKTRSVRLANNESDYSVFEGWWLEHGVQPPALAILPKLGAVTVGECGSTAEAAVWLYMSNCGTGVCWAAWHVTNPAISPSSRLKSLRLAQGHLEMLAKSMNYGFMFTETNISSLERWFVKGGFKANHKGTTQLFKVL